MPVLGPDGQPVMGVNGVPVMPVQGPQGPVLVTVDGQPVEGQPEPIWQRPPGAKSARAQRVRDYMNAQIFYRMDDWEADTDMLLMQLPIVGCAFRKVYYDGRDRKNCAKLVSAMNLVVPDDTKDLKTARRISEILPPAAPFEILEGIRSGYYRAADFVIGEEFTGAPRQLIEQHCRYDIDGDGYPEPYVVTVDHESRQVLRVVANYDADGIRRSEDGALLLIEPRHYYVKYGFFPHPEGKFYDLGLGHLLNQIGDVVDTILNQMIDAGTAQVAGGGFIGSGVRLQGAGRTSTIRMQPGEWKTVNVPGDHLRNAMVERTFPSPSAVMLNVLEMLLGAAQDLSSIKDVLTGDASNNGQVGTTLALIEQGLQMFTAIYKRVYRGLKEEFQLLFENIGRHADEATAQDYMEILDDPRADFAADFNSQDMDIRPVSDPTSVTRMQKMARAQFLGQFLSAPGVNPQAIYKRMWEAADVEDAEELLAEPSGPDPKMQSEVARNMAAAERDTAQAQSSIADSETRRLEALAKAFQAGFQAG
jgi:chaperonin GroES